MRVLGINLGRTVYGKRLYDGGACLIEDSDIVCAIAEERLTRVKHAGGYEKSLDYCLSMGGAKITDLDMIVVSSCVEPLRNIDDTLGLPRVTLDKVHVISHHLSHAYSAYMVSPFDDAIIVVVDGGGDVLEPLQSNLWWEHSREQNTYYVGSKGKITLLERQFDRPFDVGFGELYRCFTEYLGFENFFNAGKLMSIAAYGSLNTGYSNLNLFHYGNHRLLCSLKNHPPRVADMIQTWAETQGIKLPPQRVVVEPLTKEHFDLAKFVQSELEKAFIQEIRRLYDLTGIPNLCIAGGVGLNCVLNGKILEETPIKKLFVQPAAGDTGQCLGNALWGISQHLPSDSFRQKTFSVYLGSDYLLSPSKLCSLSHADCLSIRRTEDLDGEVASLIADGSLVGWFQGGAEFGPRALGNRSILADARFPGVAERLAMTKGREYFRPFAPSVLREEVDKYFDLTNYDYSYMIITANAKEETIRLFRSIVHIDDSSRLDVVSKTKNSKFYSLLRRYWHETDVPLLINTSFNKRGEPIVETPLDAIKAFRQMDLDYLVMGDLIISKKDRIKGSYDTLVNNSEERSYDISKLTLEQLIINVNRDFPNTYISLRNNFGLYYSYWDWVINGKKTTTVRYRQNAIDIPISSTLPVILSKSGNRPEPNTPPIGKVAITSIKIKSFGSLNDKDGILDGFRNAENLKIALKRFYGPIREEDLVTIYSIHLENQGD